MKKFKTLLATALLATATSTLVYANSDEQQFQQGVTAYKKQDYRTAFELFKPLAEQGNADAQYNLGLMYYNGRGVKQDYHQAVKWYQKAAEQGDAKAQFNLGGMYDNGRGVKQDYHQAVKWYQKAAEQGDANAQYNLGVSYFYGVSVTKDPLKAMYWWEKALGNGDEDAKEKIVENLSELKFAHWKACQQQGGDVCQTYERLKKWGQ